VGALIPSLVLRSRLAAVAPTDAALDAPARARLDDLAKPRGSLAVWRIWPSNFAASARGACRLRRIRSASSLWSEITE